MSISIETAFRAHCLGSTAVAAIIVDRWNPNFATSIEDRPFVVYRRISAVHERHLVAASGLNFARIQLDLFGDDSDVLRTLAEAIRLRADGYRGTVTVGGVPLVIQNIELVDESTGYQAPSDDSDSGPSSWRMDFRISAAEPVPTLT